MPDSAFPTLEITGPAAFVLESGPEGQTQQTRFSLKPEGQALRIDPIGAQHRLYQVVNGELQYFWAWFRTDQNASDLLTFLVATGLVTNTDQVALVQRQATTLSAATNLSALISEARSNWTARVSDGNSPTESATVIRFPPSP